MRWLFYEYALSFTDSGQAIIDWLDAECPIVEIPTPHGRLIGTDAIQGTHVVSIILDDGHMIGGKKK